MNIILHSYRSIGGNENNADLAKSAVPAAPVPPTGTATAPPLPFVGHPQLDTNQTFILSGRIRTLDCGSFTMIAFI